MAENAFTILAFDLDAFSNQAFSMNTKVFMAANLDVEVDISANLEDLVTPDFPDKILIKSLTDKTRVIRL